MTYLIENLPDDSEQTTAREEKTDFLSVSENGLIFGVMPTDVVDALYSREYSLKTSALEKIEEIIKVYCHSKNPLSPMNDSKFKIEGIYLPQLFSFLCKLLRAFSAPLALRIIAMVSQLIEHDT